MFLFTVCHCFIQMTQNSCKSAAFLQQWDQMLAMKKVDWQALYEQMVTVAKKEPGSVDFELWWRLAKVSANCYIVFSQADDPKEEHALKFAQEAIGWAEKALAVQPNHFEANLWMAQAAGRLARGGDETPFTDRVANLCLLLKHLAICEAQQPKHYLVPYTWARILVSLEFETDPEQKNYLVKCGYGSLLPVKLEEAEAKFRQSLAIQPMLETYVELAALLSSLGKTDQSRQIAQKGLQTEQCLYKRHHDYVIILQVYARGEPTNA